MQFVARGCEPSRPTPRKRPHRADDRPRRRRPPSRPATPAHCRPGELTRSRRRTCSRRSAALASTSFTTTSISATTRPPITSTAASRSTSCSPTTAEELHLDSDGPVVAAVTVDGRAAAHHVADGDLAIALPEPAAAGSESRVEVVYSADPRGGAGSIGLPSGWFNTPGGSYTLNEPDGAHSWLPCNDHPSDKATFTFRLSVPAGVTAVANGGLEEHTTGPDGETWVWQEDAADDHLSHPGAHRRLRDRRRRRDRTACRSCMRCSARIAP